MTFIRYQAVYLETCLKIEVYKTVMIILENK